MTKPIPASVRKVLQNWEAGFPPLDFGQDYFGGCNVFTTLKVHQNCEAGFPPLDFGQLSLGWPPSEGQVSEPRIGFWSGPSLMKRPGP